MSNPEIGKWINAGGINTNYHDVGEGYPTVLIHGSGPGVSAFSNWRLAFPVLSQKVRVLAPDMLGFGYSQRLDARHEGLRYDMDTWVQQALNVMDAMGVEKADVVVVLSGNEKDRLVETLRILREGYAPLVLLTETEDLAGGGSSMSTIDKVVTARNLGIASEAILVTKRTATSTRDEGLAVLEVAQQRQFDSVIVVTDPYHCLRTRLLFRSIFRGSGIDVSVRPVRDHWYRSYNWWLSAEGRRATLSETTKLFFFMLGLRGD